MYRSRITFALAMAALAAILLPSPLPAQITFQRTYGGAADDEGNSVLQTNDGGYIVAGYTSSSGAGGYDVYVVKTDSIGDEIWARTYGDAGSEGGFSVQQTYDSGYVIAGHTNSLGAGGNDVYLIKTDAGGDVQWSKTYGGAADDGGCSVQQTADSGYIIAGYTMSFGAGEGDIYLVKTDANGDTQWTRTFGGSHADEGCAVEQSTDGGYIIAAGTTSFGSGNWDAYVIKADANGDTLWTRTFGGPYKDEGYSVQQTSDGGFITTGATELDVGHVPDVYLVKTNADGDSLWTRAVESPDGAYGWSVRQTADSGYVIAGTAYIPGRGDDLYLVRTNVAGDTLWTRTFGGDSSDYGWSVDRTGDGGLIVVGITKSFGAGDGDVYLIKADSLGNVAVAEPKASPTRAPALSLFCEPNPATGTTTIHLTPFASRHSPLALRIYDAQGRAVRSFSSLLSPPSSLTWDGKDDLGQPLPSGAYFIRCDFAGEQATTRVVLQR